jgi:hypothetical protein
LTAGGIAIQTIKRRRAGAAEVELAVRRVFRLVTEFAFEVLPAAFVAGALDVSLELAEPAFVIASHVAPSVRF